MSQPHSQLGALETYRQNSNSNNRISREDILARSPPKPLIDQQRPYQISLPGGEIEDDEDVVSTPSRSQHPQSHPPYQLNQNPPASTSVSGRKPQHDSITRLQQPILRHPESPAGYPLPEDTVFSPVNPSAVDFPPPPPPKWPSHEDGVRGYQNQSQQSPRGGHGHDRQASLSTSDLDVHGDLDRSNTRRTAVSAISGISAARPHSGSSQNGAAGGLSLPPSGGGASRGLNVPPQEDVSMRGGVRVVSPSPTPPSPMDGDSDGRIRRTDVEVRPRASMKDLYSASDGELPPPAPSQVSNGHAHASNGHANGSGKGHARGNGIEVTKHPEEKIFYDQSPAHLRVGQDGPAELEDHETSMSATSYPGQEWNPYAMGAWDDGDDVGPAYR